MDNENCAFKSLKQDWGTPKEFYDKLNEEFGFDFDPCPKSNYLNGGSVNGKKLILLTPPYTSKEQDLFIKKGFEEWKKGKTVVFLIPARTDTKRFHDYLLPYAEIRFIKGRLKFEGAKFTAPFPSMVCILRGSKRSKI